MSDFHTEKPVAMLPKYYFYRVIVVRLRLITDDNAEHMLDIYGVVCLMKAFFFFFRKRTYHHNNNCYGNEHGVARLKMTVPSLLLKITRHRKQQVVIILAVGDQRTSVLNIRRTMLLHCETLLV